MLHIVSSASHAPAGPRVDRRRSVRATRALTLFLIAATSALFEGSLKVFVGAPGLRSRPLGSVAMNFFTGVPESAKQEPAKEEASAAVPTEEGPKRRLSILVQRALRKPMVKGGIVYVTDSSTGVSESTLTLPVLGHDELLSFKGSGGDPRASEANAAQVAIDQLRSSLEEQAAQPKPQSRSKKNAETTQVEAESSPLVVASAKRSAKADLMEKVQKASAKRMVVGDIVYTTVSSDAGFESTLTMPVMGEFVGFRGTAASKKDAEDKAATVALDQLKSSLQEKAKAAQLKKSEQLSLDSEIADQKQEGPKRRLSILVTRALRKPMVKGGIVYVTDSSTGVSESTLTLPVLGHDELLSFKGSGGDPRASEANAAQVAIDQLRSSLEEQAAQLKLQSRSKKNQLSLDSEIAAQKFTADIIRELETDAKSIEMELTEQQFDGLLLALANLPERFQASSEIVPILQETNETTQHYTLRINRDATLPVGATSMNVSKAIAPRKLAAAIRQSMEEKSELPDLHFIGSMAAKTAMKTIGALQKSYTQEGRFITFMSRRQAMTTAEDVELQGIAVSLMVA